MSDAYAEITATMQRYFDGLYHSDTNVLRTVFHPDARYVCATDDSLVNMGMDEYFPIVDARPAPAASGQQRRDAIASIGLAGPKTAIVRAHCAIGPKYFTDLLTMILTDEGWRIISKVFHYDLDA